MVCRLSAALAHQGKRAYMGTRAPSVLAIEKTQHIPMKGPETPVYSKIQDNIQVKF